jgi:hypothetical protein
MILGFFDLACQILQRDVMCDKQNLVEFRLLCRVLLHRRYGEGGWVPWV